ncbi:L,D-transpeptidase [Yoonia sp. 208BN28-4]|uniref:L,D-transpeptidase n=1 Tax=Yoonia sp. 208BN28-4 TaxID=3126505 RepID=UPI0030AFAC47
MLTRRHFIATGAFSSILAAHPAFAQEAVEPAPSAEPADPLAPTQVTLAGAIPANQIHMDPNTFRLYFSVGGDQAIRYAVGVGRPGLYEPGAFFVGAKKEWPSWTPTPDMIEREPEKYKQYEDGMPGGPNNPLGARALYLFQPGRGDTYLRIHGTNSPRTIGTAVSNGCARLTNEYIVDLYDRVPLRSNVFLYTRTG